MFWKNHNILFAEGSLFERIICVHHSNAFFLLYSIHSNADFVKPGRLLLCAVQKIHGQAHMNTCNHTGTSCNLQGWFFLFVFVFFASMFISAYNILHTNYHVRLGCFIIYLYVLATCFFSSRCNQRVYSAQKLGCLCHLIHLQDQP